VLTCRARAVGRARRPVFCGCCTLRIVRPVFVSAHSLWCCASGLWVKHPLGRAPLSCARFLFCAPPRVAGLTHPSGSAVRACARATPSIGWSDAPSGSCGITSGVSPKLSLERRTLRVVRLPRTEGHTGRRTLWVVRPALVPARCRAACGALPPCCCGVYFAATLGLCVGFPAQATRRPPRERRTLRVVRLRPAQVSHCQTSGATLPPGRAAPLRARPDPSGAESDATFGLCCSSLWLSGAARRVVVCTLLFAQSSLSHPWGCADSFRVRDAPFGLCGVLGRTPRVVRTSLAYADLRVARVVARPLVCAAFRCARTCARVCFLAHP